MPPPQCHGKSPSSGYGEEECIAVVVAGGVSRSPEGTSGALAVVYSCRASALGEQEVAESNVCRRIFWIPASWRNIIFVGERKQCALETMYSMYRENQLAQVSECVHLCVKSHPTEDLAI